MAFVSAMKKVGQEIAQDLKSELAHAAILVSA